MSARRFHATLAGASLVAALGATLAARVAGAQPTAIADAARVLRGTVRDAVTGTPLTAARVDARDGRALTDADGRFAVRAAPGDTLVVHRVGYRAARLVVPAAAGQGTLTLALVPTGAASRVARLAPVAVTGTASPSDATARESRLSAVVPTAEARRLGAVSLADAVGLLPFVAARGAQGSTVVSMRGARPEQVAVTLDGVPLTDPATGRADLADVPLAALGAVGAVPGADALGAGPGALGGTLALTSGARPALAATLGAFGLAQVEGAATTPLAGGRLRAGGMWRSLRNDFRFVNRDGATGRDSVETRTNDDERRASVFASAVLPRAQLLVLASDAERGMAGPMNVRVYDADRGRTRRATVRAAVQPGAWSLSAALRAFGTEYRDPNRPTNAFDASSLSGDVEAARAFGAVAVRAGAGGDRARATEVRAQARGRAFAAVQWSAGGARWRASAGVRGDAVGGGAGARLSPSLSGERALLGVVAADDARPALVAYARVAQAFRAPTLSDLYFSSPQRIVARPLQPERARLDAELGLRARAGRATAAGALFARRTDDAIVWFPGNFGWSPTNVGEERVHGAEGRAELAALPTPLGALSVRGWAGVTVARLRIVRDDGLGLLVIPTPYVPQAAGGGSVELRRGPAFLAGTLQALARRGFANAPADRTLELPGVALVGARAGVRLGRAAHGALLVLAVDNVGDVEWQSVRRYPMPGRSWSLGLTLDR